MKVAVKVKVNQLNEVKILLAFQQYKSVYYTKMLCSIFSVFKASENKKHKIVYSQIYTRKAAIRFIFEYNLL